MLIVDDSALMRKILKKILEEDSRLEVIDSARDGEEAIEKNFYLSPDVITMDINMPKMDGLTALQYIMNTSPCSVVILSSLSKRGAMVTYEALELGAVDFIAKPEGTVSVNLEDIGEEIRRKVLAAAEASWQNSRRLVSRRQKKKVSVLPSATSGSAQLNKVVFIGVSTGGPKTLGEILPYLPAGFPAPVVVVQHMPEGFTRYFAERLDGMCALKVVEAENGQELEKGKIYVAKGGCQLGFEKRLGHDGIFLRLSKEPKTLYVPSVSFSLGSLRKCISDKQIVAAILTGMGDDGADEMVKVRAGGGFTIAESRETAVVWGMPREAWERGGAEVLAPFYEIADFIIQGVNG